MAPPACATWYWSSWEIWVELLNGNCSSPRRMSSAWSGEWNCCIPIPSVVTVSPYCPGHSSKKLEWTAPFFGGAAQSVWQTIHQLKAVESRWFILLSVQKPCQNELLNASHQSVVILSVLFIFKYYMVRMLVVDYKTIHLQMRVDEQETNWLTVEDSWSSNDPVLCVNIYIEP